MIISVDTGNKHIKTENFVFQAGLHEMDSPPPDLNTKVLESQGKFYVPSNKRIAYMKDKTLDDRYFILTLLGTAMELENRIQKGFYHLIPDRPVSIELTPGASTRRLYGVI